MKQSPRKPTASELEILRVLWSRGPSTVRQVLDALTEKKEMGYTGVLKLLQIMAAKGTVRGATKAPGPMSMKPAAPPNRPSGNWQATCWNGYSKAPPAN